MLGAGFDCASRAEIEQVVGLGVAADRIIFANTVKMRSHLAFARQSGVAKLTFDDANELGKIRECYPEAELVLRILPPPSRFLHFIISLINIRQK